MPIDTSLTGSLANTLSSRYLQELDLSGWLKKLSPHADWMAFRFVGETSSHRGVRNGHPHQNHTSFDFGLMVEAMLDGHIGYSATCNLSEEGIRQAVEKALQQTRLCKKLALNRFSHPAQRPTARGHYRSHSAIPFDKASLSEWTDFLLLANSRLKSHSKIVNAESELVLTETRVRYWSTSGTEIEQNFSLVTGQFGVVSQDGTETQRRSLNGPVARCFQGGLEVIEKDLHLEACERVAREAVELLSAEDCPSGSRDLILAPDQMLLQIHESIGHPLEYDRILGDERNYAGWSFVQPEDFGKLQYGSSLLNVTFDPTVGSEFASYAFDDCGNQAEREYLIRDGVLLRGLGSLESQARLKLPGVANFRASSWNRAPIDRMANINVEPGLSTLAEMIAGTEKGIYMQSNISWSIDDYRNKFQFGCEYAQLIEQGQLTKVVKNPNYRGVSVPFWNSLAAVGRAEEVEIFGSPFCGKGEPSQVIRVGHSSPPCLFKNVEVFGRGTP
jgi:predicted Zn-dependent protease